VLVSGDPDFLLTGNRNPQSRLLQEWIDRSGGDGETGAASSDPLLTDYDIPNELDPCSSFYGTKALRRAAHDALIQRCFQVDVNNWRNAQGNRMKG
jgi:hypothetical protein